MSQADTRRRGVLRKVTRHPRMLATGWAARLSHVVPPPLPAEYDDELVATIARVRRHTMTSPRRLAALVDAVVYVEDAGVPGAIVECGVWRGGSMMAVALTLSRLGATNRDLWLFDTFAAGMTAPSQRDANSPYDGYSLAAMWRRRGNWHGVALADVQAALATTGYPAANLHFVEGQVEQTLPAHAPDQIAILRLDTDWYASTRHELEHLYPRLAPGGVLILDDYGHYPGAQQAVDDYFADRGEAVLLHRIDHTGRMAVRVTRPPERSR